MTTINRRENVLRTCGAESLLDHLWALARNGISAAMFVRQTQAQWPWFGPLFAALAVVDVICAPKWCRWTYPVTPELLLLLRVEVV